MVGSRIEDRGVAINLSDQKSQENRARTITQRNPGSTSLSTDRHVVPCQKQTVYLVQGTTATRNAALVQADGWCCSRSRYVTKVVQDKRVRCERKKQRWGHSQQRQHWKRRQLSSDGSTANINRNEAIKGGQVGAMTISVRL